MASAALAACKNDVAKAPEPIRPVKVVTASQSAPTKAVTFSGSVKPRIEQVLSFRIAGKIIERKVNIGERIVPGDVLARLDTTDYSLSLKTAEANVDAARTRVDVAADALVRARELYSKGFVAKSVLDQRSLDSDQAKSAYDATRAARDQAVNQTRYGDLVADISGIVTDVRAEAGQVVAAGTPVISVAPDKGREVAVAIPEQSIRLISVGEAVTTRYWAEPELVQTGTIREISGSADPASRTFAVRVTIPDDPRLRLGQTATVTANVALDAPSIVLPLPAIDKRGPDTLVWVVDAGTDTVTSRKVTIDGVTAEGVRMISGVKPGDLVVVAGTQFMRDGLKVRIAPPDAETARLD
ncbi:MAG: efflux RND transporter periplasmic adaptor subunit [Ancalomicrobiaceae bacterium]|nr:efflux RND transporter periplasmic adaptor subunit [Ancalomicrobiaceae bacterium]